MADFKSIHPEAIDSALEKAKHYRLLNDPENAESICQDILALVPDHQEALINLILAMTDQFNRSAASSKPARAILAKLTSEYDREYYAGLIFERSGKVLMMRSNPESHFAAYDRFRTAMEHFEKAESLSNDSNDDAVLRWNSCARMIEKHNLQQRPEDNYVPYGDA